MKGNLKNLLPTAASLLIFSSIFVILILRNTESPEGKSQVSPKKSMYKNKFGNVSSYKTDDITTAGLLKNIRLNGRGGVSEPKIICNPKNKNILAVSANDFSDDDEGGCVFISEDGGSRWQTKRVPLSLKFKNSTYSDPWMDYDSEGNLFFTAVQFDVTNIGKEGIFLARSTDNGTTWKTDYNFVDYNGKENIHLDRARIYIDKSSTRENSIYITWIEIKGLNSFLIFSKSTDGGITFSLPAVIESHGVKYCSLTGDRNGILYAVYLKDENTIIFIKSDDGGISWNKEFSHLDIIPSGNPEENQYVIKNSGSGGIRINSEPSIEISKENDLLVTYSASGERIDKSDIYFVRLNNNSNEISNPVKVNSDKSDNDQFFPSITTDQSGSIIIVYQDSRNDINNILTESYLSVSTDGGLTFRDENLSTAAYNPAAVAVARYFGDYNSCLISNENLIGVWTDGRNNNYDIYAGIFNLKEFIENMNQ